MKYDGYRLLVAVGGGTARAYTRSGLDWSERFAPLLDAAALRIARLAEPYPPLPRTREDPDILNVVRTWQFMPGGTMLDTNAGEAP